ncbi:MAG TPA: acyl-CoA dehydrogenase [Syntrophales bacterium]|nr:acyl-CoA dehydrogenase [Syntrophales bacterium]HOL59144.1 acyl-CoA dehydrogenase [Syntrophales bacterium]HPO36089.1 acyl-CoA dehydrogenase [Syntrophales bacterium]
MEYKYDIRDLKFILKEWLPTAEVAACDRFKETFSLDDIDMLLNEGFKVAKEVLHPINAPGDKIGVKFENGQVTPVPGFKEAYQFLQQNGWGSTSECIMIETGMPLIMYKAIFEMNTGACPALTSCIKLTSGAANLLLRFGTEKDKEMFLPKMFSGEWQGTMCLTEPNYGSDVGDIITRAYPTEDPRIYKIKGTKMFITAGDQGHCENTIHMVLARPEGGAPGSPGIGLFIVPKIWVNEDGSLGEPNDVTTVRLEHKMGLHAQATAMLNFGDEDRCRGILMGPPPDEKGRSQGLAMMFYMMNESRIGTGHNANSQAAAAYYFASQFAQERIQGRPFGIKDAERVPIIKHEDIRRMLLDMKSHVDGIRAMIFKGFYYLDIEANSSNKEWAEKCGDYAAILTPIIKCYGSEASLGVIGQAIQVLGGVGYTQEYPVEQYLRDSKILTIWEGTSFIHAQDLVNRKMRMKGGKPFRDWMAEVRNFAEANKNAEGFKREMDNLLKGCACMEEVAQIYDNWYANMDKKRSLIPLYAIKALFVYAQVYVAYCLLDQALIAQKKLTGCDPYDMAFYQGKIATARYYANNILPQAFLATEMIRLEDDTVITCPEESLILR